jgi:hypothetical protein
MSTLLVALVTFGAFQLMTASPTCLFDTHNKVWSELSPSFHRAFAEYSEFHRKSMEEIGDLQKEIARIIDDDNFLSYSIEKRQEQMPYRFLLVYTDASGLGNRLNSILTGFIWAILSKRILLIRSDSFDYSELLCEPFQGSSWIFPFNWTKNEIYENLQRYSNHSPFKLQKFEANCHPCFETILQEDFFHDQLQQWIVYSNGELYGIPVFFLSKYYRKLLEEWFPNHFVAHELVHYLIKPANPVYVTIQETMTKITDSLKDKPTPHCSLGIQYRNFGLDQEELCLPTFLSSSNNNSNNNNCSRSLFFSSMKNVTEILSIHFPTALTFPHDQRYYDQKEQHDILQTQHALHDIFILAMMDDVIVSPHSTFGYMVQALRPWSTPLKESKRKSQKEKKNIQESLAYLSRASFNVLPGYENPYVHGIIPYMDNVLSDRSCYRLLSPEPCFHFDFHNETYYHLPFASSINSSSSLLLFMPCEDRSEWSHNAEGKRYIGIKLVVNFTQT